jgi:hypothetical protein
MDLTRPVTYRGFSLNTIDTLPGDGRRKGCIVEEVDFGDVMGVGYTEKRAQGDGLDASDVYLSGRQVRMRGYIYGETKADGFDRLQELRSVLTPTAAYLDSPSEKGYLPLEFDVPTQNVTDFPDGWRLMQMFARPRAQPQFSVRRDAGSQGEHLSGNAIAWSSQLECADPRLYLRDEQWEHFVGSEMGSLHNRGDYPAYVDVLLDVQGPCNSGSIRIEMGGSDVTIKVPASTPAQVIRYSASLGVVTVSTAGGAGEVLRMDLLVREQHSPQLMLPPGVVPYTITKATAGTTTFTPNTRMMFHEAFA